MTTSTELKNPKSYIRKINSNNNNKSLSINLPLKIADRYKITPDSYVVIEEYHDQRNQLTLRKLDINEKEEEKI